MATVRVVTYENWGQELLSPHFQSPHFPAFASRVAANCKTHGREHLPYNLGAAQSVTLDGFLTVLGLAAAIYAVVPTVPRLRARLAIWIQAPVALVAFLAALYFEFFDLVAGPCGLPWADACEALTLRSAEGLQPGQAAFLVVLIWMGMAWTIHKLARPGAGALPAINRLVDELIYEHRYGELIAFIEPYLPFIADADDRRLPLQKLTDQFDAWRGRNAKEKVWRGVLNHEPAKPDTGWAIWRRLLPVVGWLGGWVPRQRRAEEAASDTIRVLFNSVGLRAFVVSMRPYFGLSLLAMTSSRPADFCELYLGDLLALRGSALYQELEQNQNFSHSHRYSIPQRNRILHFLLSDATRAESLGAWKPVGDGALKVLRPGADNLYLAELNRKPENFDAACWNDPVWVALFFFDVMVSEAAYQDIKWHMWLFYLSDIVEGLVASYDDSAREIDPQDEFPTVGARLIYAAFAMLGNWVHLAEEVPEGSSQRIVHPDIQHENGNIPKSAALAMGQCLSHVLLSDKISPKFARYMMEVVARDVQQLPEGAAVRAALVIAISEGGSEFLTPQYAEKLRDALDGMDHGLRFDVKDLLAASGV